MLGMSQPLAFRNKRSIPCVPKWRASKLAFSKNSHQVVDIAACPVQHDRRQQSLQRSANGWRLSISPVTMPSNRLRAVFVMSRSGMALKRVHAWLYWWRWPTIYQEKQNYWRLWQRSTALIAWSTMWTPRTCIILAIQQRVCLVFSESIEDELRRYETCFYHWWSRRIRSIRLTRNKPTNCMRLWRCVLLRA